MPPNNTSEPMPGNRYDEVAKYVGANVNLWPRPLVIFAGGDVVESASVTAKRTAPPSGHHRRWTSGASAARADDEEVVLSLCGQGATFAVASGTELIELRRTLEPLYAELRSDPGTKAALDTITSLKLEIGASEAAPTCPSTAPPGTASAIPEGRYEMTLTFQEDWLRAGITVEDWVEAGQSEKEASESTGKYVMIIDAGELTILSPNGEPGFQASYSVFRDQIEAQEAEDFTILARWSLRGDALSFSDVRVPHGDARIAIVAWTTHPWVRADWKQGRQPWGRVRALLHCSRSTGRVATSRVPPPTGLMMEKLFADCFHPILEAPRAPSLWPDQRRRCHVEESCYCPPGRGDRDTLDLQCRRLGRA